MCSNASFATTNESPIHEDGRRSPDLITRNETELLQPSNNSTTHIANINKIKSNTSLTEPPATTTTTTTTAIIKCKFSPMSNKHATPEMCKANNCKESNVDTCPICTESTSVYAVAQCNHRVCFVCALRSRVLFGTNSCPYCRAKQHKVIFTHDAVTPFSVLMSSRSWYLISDHQILCEDQQIYHVALDMIRFKCPVKSCQATCDGGWHELSQHVRNDHKLMFCSRCIAHRKIFTWEHMLYTKEELKRHYRSGDAKDSNFRGHPSCIECNVTFYDLIEFREHYLMHHALIPVNESPRATRTATTSQSTEQITSSSSSSSSSSSRVLTAINTTNNVLDSNNNSNFDISALFFCIFSVFTTLLSAFSIPDDNKYFASIIQALDGLTSSVFNINVDDTNFTALHTIFTSIYSFGLRLIFAAFYLTTIFWVLKSWFLMMSWILYFLCGIVIFKLCWEHWVNC